jgi:hypothetical protein
LANGNINGTCVCGAGNNPPCYSCHGVSYYAGVASQGAPATVQPTGGTGGDCSIYVLEKGTCNNGVCEANAVGNCSTTFVYVDFQPQ